MKTLREEIEEVLAENCNYCGRGEPCTNCPQDADAILTAVRGRVPKKKKINWRENDEDVSQDIGFNDAIDAMHEAIGGGE